MTPTRGDIDMTTRLWIDMIGWVGAMLLLAAYALVTTERWRGRSFRFQLCNAFGSACLIANTVYYRAYPSAVVNVVWVMIAVFALASARRIRQGR